MLFQRFWFRNFFLLCAPCIKQVSSVAEEPRDALRYVQRVVNKGERSA